MRERGNDCRAILRLCAVIAGLGIAPAMADDREACIKESGDVAIEACNRIINLGRGSASDLADAYVSRGQEYYVKRELDRAIADFNEALRLKPKYAMAYGDRANAYFLKDEYDRAIGDYTLAIAIDPKYTAAYTGRGLAHERLGALESARADFNAALSVPPKYDDGKWAHDAAREGLEALKER